MGFERLERFEPLERLERIDLGGFVLVDTRIHQSHTEPKISSHTPGLSIPVIV